MLLSGAEIFSIVNDNCNWNNSKYKIVFQQCGKEKTNQLVF